jgi:hypothetical protein
MLLRREVAATRQKKDTEGLSKDGEASSIAFGTVFPSRYTRTSKRSVVRDARSQQAGEHVESGHSSDICLKLVCIDSGHISVAVGLKQLAWQRKSQRHSLCQCSCLFRLSTSDHVEQ